MAAVVAISAGCGVQPTVEQGNYLTFDHAFTDRAAEEVRRKAEALCRERKQAAAKVSTACSLTRCVTHYQCVGKASGTQQPMQQ